ncbi:MAG TPA: putative 2OG-Fe(II) oxygenase [Sphingomicrobium sp.]|nr:putative 2OG-Fe(II) oxygenase [Sphingomicrobium sp.]
MVQDPHETSFAQLEERGLELEREWRLEEAREAFDAALCLNPDAQSSAEGRARVALALREDSAAEHCARALTFHNARPDRQLRMILTAAAELGDGAIPLLEDYLRRHPQDPTAHETLAEIRAEWRGGEEFLDGYIDALRKYPKSKPLLFSYWNTLARAGRTNDAIDSMDACRELFAGDRDFTLLELKFANHAGLTKRADLLADRLDDRPDALLARGQHLLQIGNPEKAAELLEAVVRAEPRNLSAWALIELAWRVTSDARHKWLIGEPPLYGLTELSLSSSELDDVASTLRSLHRTCSQPIGQSVRGGTQTPGQLFLRPEPQILQLTDAITLGIRQFVSQLPGPDPRHPLLKHRNEGLSFGPSWSVRFTGGGYHAAHFHPNGILSSACYIQVPEALTDDPEKSGWLELGRPPPELNLDVPPLATIEPKAGRLVLFPSFLFHGTRPFLGGERMSVAFDLVPVSMDL